MYYVQLLKFTVDDLDIYRFYLSSLLLGTLKLQIPDVDVDWRKMVQPNPFPVSTVVQGTLLK